MPITANVEGFEQASERMAARAARVSAALYQKIFKLCIEVQTKVQGNLAEGIGLKSRHGTSGLAGSVRVIEPVTEGTQITGEVQGGGGPTWYGGMWEFTGHGIIVPVTKRALHFFANGKEVFTTRVSAQGPRPWMIPPFNELKPYIAAEIRATAIAAAKGEDAAGG